MNRVVLKMAIFILTVTTVGALNSWIINGPLLHNNTVVSMNQFNPTAQSTAGDFQVFGYWVAFNNVYILEAVLLAVFACILFSSHVCNLLGFTTKAK